MFRYYTLYKKNTQTCQPPRGKNLEILDLELEKVVRGGKKSQDVPHFLVEGLPAGIMGLEVKVSF